MFEELNWAQVLQVDQDSNSADFLNRALVVVDFVDWNVRVEDSCEAVLFFAERHCQDSFELEFGAAQEEIFFEAVVVPEFDGEVF